MAENENVQKPLRTVKVPPPFEPMFRTAQTFVKDYFKKIHFQAAQGQIVIGGERYILVRAKSMSIHFSEFIANIYPDLEEEERITATGSILFDIAHAIGKADAKAFHIATNVTEPIDKLATGPVHFAYSGWAYVDISEESKPSPDENYYLLYDHPFSFEADSWLDMGKRTNHTTCYMNSGYSSGWCEESYGLELTSKEILCRAQGDSHCRFIMGHPAKMEQHINEYKSKHPELFPE